MGKIGSGAAFIGRKTKNPKDFRCGIRSKNSSEESLQVSVFDPTCPRDEYSGDRHTQSSNRRRNHIVPVPVDDASTRFMKIDGAPALHRHSAGMPLSIRPATVADVPLILTFIRALAEYEKLSDEVIAT